MERYYRTVDQVWENMSRKSSLGVYPYIDTKFEDNEKIMKSLKGISSKDHDAWAEAYGKIALTYEVKAKEAEAQGNIVAAKENYLLAYGLYRVGRFPAPLSLGKIESYKKTREMFLAAANYFTYPVERVEIPFEGRPGEGKVIIAYYQRPKMEGKFPLLMQWSGIDSFKEDDMSKLCETFLNAGAATLSLDMPGTGESPLAGSIDAERMWDAVFKWIDSRPELDEQRVVGWGTSTGGYWAAKVAHTHCNRFAGVVDHGGATHYTFTEEWLEKAQHGHYQFNLIETLALAFGRKSFDEFVQECPKLSLLEQGILDMPSAPMLLVNGINDTVFTIKDMYLLLEHGNPKEARFLPGEHMALENPKTMPIIIKWIMGKLRV